MPPEKLTQSLPDSELVNKEQEAYVLKLEERLHKCMEILDEQLKHRSDYISNEGDQHKKHLCARVDDQMKHNRMVLERQRIEQLILLENTTQEQRLAYADHANMVRLKCNYTKAMDNLNLEHYKFQTEHYNSLLQCNKEMKLLQAQQEATTLQVARQRSLLAQQFAASAQLAAAQLSGASQTQPQVPPFMIPQRPSTLGVSPPSDCNDQRVSLDTSVAPCVLSL